ncbi:hypothetical protein G9C98_001408 [Cotesia typhae]|uniref:CABIT domain-containing protein n=3 Tax=Cotesia typhae TaxID=2053667 RepID=A0A8J5QWW5_9HYME|nr:hypothetical protein G9C98_001408 [Cotesia typhae]
MKNSRLSERDQYAQFLDSRGHELFVPLSSRCELYATCQSGSLDTESDAVLYRIHQLVNRELPLRVRLIAGPLPIPLPRNYNGLMQFENATHGPIVLGCAIPMIPERPIPTVATPELLELVTTGPGALRVKRVRLGFPSESRLLGSHKMQRLLSACRRALDQRATEPRIAPLKLLNSDNHPKELHLIEIKSQLEAKPLLQSLKDSLEHIKKTTICDRSYSKSSGNSNNPSFLERLSKITHSNKCRNPAKKSASFTFAVRPEIGMKVSDPYGSLESDTNGLSSNFFNNNAQKQLVYRSISTSALEIQRKTGSNFPYSKVRDNLTQLPSALPLKVEDIYTEICDPSNIGSKKNFYRSSKINSSLSKVCANKKDQGYIKVATHSEVPNVSNTTIEEENIYNTVS